jgi:peroxiredoxin
VLRGLSSLAVVLLLLNVGCYTGSRPTHVGAPAKDFAVKDSDRSVNLTQFRGQVLVLNFWATWCPPCTQELPSLMSMQERLRSRGVIVLGVSIDVDEAAYHRFLQQRGVNFMTVRDPEQRVASMYGTSGWPETYIIDRQGVVRRKVIGPLDWDSADVLKLLTSL